MIRVELEAFRCFARLEVELAPGFNLLVGGNAQGKTSFLEALAVLASARSFRAGSDRELMAWGGEYARVRARLARDSGVERTLELRWEGSSGGAVQRQALIQGRFVSRLADFLGEVPLALFTPADLALVGGPPRMRRQFLDRLLCKLYPAYLSALSRYQKVLLQRNALLRTGSVPRPEVLGIWDDQLAALGAHLVRRREETCRELNRWAGEIYGRLSGGGDDFSLSYRPSVAGEARDFVEALQGRRSEELRHRMTLIGPHRDEVKLCLGERDLRTYGSQGEQRTAALALRLAEARVLQERSGEGAVMLLDDCLSELDPDRRCRALELLDGHPQVLLTGTTLPDPLPPRCVVYRVADGSVAREGG